MGNKHPTTPQGRSSPPNDLLSSLRLPQTLTGEHNQHQPDPNPNSNPNPKPNTAQLVHLQLDWLFPFTPPFHRLKNTFQSDVQSELDRNKPPASKASGNSTSDANSRANAASKWQSIPLLNTAYARWDPSDVNEKFKGLPSVLLLRLVEIFFAEVSLGQHDEAAVDLHKLDELLCAAGIALRSEHNRHVLHMLGMTVEMPFAICLRKLLLDLGKRCQEPSMEGDVLLLRCLERLCLCLRMLTGACWKDAVQDEEQTKDLQVEALWKAVLPPLREALSALWEQLRKGSGDRSLGSLEGMLRALSAVVDATGAVLSVSPADGVEWFIGHGVELLTHQLEDTSILSDIGPPPYGRGVFDPESDAGGTALLELWARQCAVIVHVLTLAKMPLARHRHEPALFRVLLAFDASGLESFHQGPIRFPLQCGKGERPAGFCMLMKALCTYVTYWRGPLGNALALAWLHRVGDAHWVAKLHAADLLLQCVDLPLDDVKLTERFLFDLPIGARHDVAVRLIPKERLCSFVIHALKENDDKTLLILHHALHPEGLPLPSVLRAAEQLAEVEIPSECITVLLDMIEAGASVEEDIQDNSHKCSELLSLLLKNDAHLRRFLPLLERLFEGSREEEVSTWLAERITVALQRERPIDTKWIVQFLEEAKLQMIASALTRTRWLAICIAEAEVEPAVDVVVAAVRRSVAFQQEFIRAGVYTEISRMIKARVVSTKRGDSATAAGASCVLDARDGSGASAEEDGGCYSKDNERATRSTTDTPDEPYSESTSAGDIPGTSVHSTPSVTINAAAQTSTTDDFFAWFTHRIGLTEDGLLQDAMLLYALLVAIAPVAASSRFDSLICDVLKHLDVLPLDAHDQLDQLPLSHRVRRLANATACADVLDIYGGRPIIGQLCEILQLVASKDYPDSPVARAVVRAVVSVTESCGDVRAVQLLVSVAERVPKLVLDRFITGSRDPELAAIYMPNASELQASVALTQRVPRLVFSACIRLHEVGNMRGQGMLRKTAAFSFRFEEMVVQVKLHMDGSIELVALCGDGNKCSERSTWQLLPETMQEFRLMFTGSSAMLTLNLPKAEKPSVLTLRLPASVSFTSFGSFASKKEASSQRRATLKLRISGFAGELFHARLGFTLGLERNRARPRSTLWSIVADSFHPFRGVFLSGEEGETKGRCYPCKRQGLLAAIQALGGLALPIHLLKTAGDDLALAWLQVLLLELDSPEERQKMCIHALCSCMRHMAKGSVTEEAGEGCRSIARALKKRKGKKMGTEQVFVSMCRHVLLDVNIWNQNGMADRMLQAVEHVEPRLLRQILSPSECVDRILFYVRKQSLPTVQDPQASSPVFEARRAWRTLQQQHEPVASVYETAAALINLFVYSLGDGEPLDLESVHALKLLILVLAGSGRTERDHLQESPLLEVLLSQPASTLLHESSLSLKNMFALLACSRSAVAATEAVKCWTQFVSKPHHAEHDRSDLDEAFWTLLRDMYAQEVDIDDLDAMIQALFWCIAHDPTTEPTEPSMSSDDSITSTSTARFQNAMPPTAAVAQLPCDAFPRRNVLESLRDELRRDPHNCRVVAEMSEWQHCLLDVLRPSCREARPGCTCTETVIACMDAVHLQDLLSRAADPGNKDGCCELMKTLAETTDESLRAILVNRVVVLVEQECVKWAADVREALGLTCIDYLATAMDASFQVQRLQDWQDVEQWFLAIESFLALLNTLDVSPLELKNPHPPCDCDKCLTRVKLVPVLTRLLLITIHLTAVSESDAIEAMEGSPGYGKGSGSGKAQRSRKTGVHARALVYISSMRESGFLSEKQEFYVIACLVHTLMTQHNLHTRFVERASAVIQNWLKRQATPDLARFLPPLEGRGSVPPTAWDPSIADTLGLTNHGDVTDWQFAAVSHFRLGVDIDLDEDPRRLSASLSSTSNTDSCRQLLNLLSKATDALAERRNAHLEDAAERRHHDDMCWQQLCYTSAALHRDAPPARWKMGLSESVSTRIRPKLARFAPSPSCDIEVDKHLDVELLLMAPCSIISATKACEGRLIVRRSALYLQVVESTSQTAVPAPSGPIEEAFNPISLLSSAVKSVLSKASRGVEEPSPERATATATKVSFKAFQKWPLDAVVRVEVRRFRRQWTAVELFIGSTDRRTFFLDFASKGACKRVLKCVGKLIHQSDAVLSPSDRARRLQRLMKAWQQREISNLRYLMLLNTLAGRTYNDLSQYPVMPWVLQDYESKMLDLSAEDSFRDLRFPAGAQCETHRTALRRKFEETQLQAEAVESGEEEVGLGPEAHRILHGPAWHFGSHYLSRGTVLWYLVRMEPYTTLHVKLQDGRFDHADRQFGSMHDAWHSIAKPTGMELTPEFYGCPEFLRLDPGVSLGQRQDGKIVGDVELPAWAEGSPEKFVYLNRKALESEHVSRNLHHWIDLIFGYKQRGQAAIDAFNTYFHLMYDEAVDLSAVKATGQELYDTVINISNEYGQIPPQLFKEPHLQRREMTPPDRSPPKPVLLKLVSVVPIEGSRLYDNMIRSSGGESLATVDTEGTLSIINLIRDGAETYTHCNTLGHLNGKSMLKRSPLLGKQSVVVCKDMIVSCGYIDGSIRSRRISTRAPHVQHYNHHKGVVTCLAVGEKHKWLVSGSLDCTLVVWKIKRDMIKLNKWVYGHVAPVTSVAVCTDLDVIISADVDKRCCIHTMEKGELLHLVDLSPQLPAALRSDRAAIPTWIGISPQMHYACIFIAEANVLFSLSVNARIVSTATLDGTLRIPPTLVHSADGEYILATTDSSVLVLDVFTLQHDADRTVRLPRDIYNLTVLHRNSAGESTVLVNTVDSLLYLLTYCF